MKGLRLSLDRVSVLQRIDVDISGGMQGAGQSSHILVFCVNLVSTYFCFPGHFFLFL